ncbi:MAG TPA: carboxypeptidase-like regulatory domain-containing protein [Terracidiphilus sp.]
MRRLHLALFVALFGSALSYGATPGSVSGLVRDSAGVPQIGAVVELLRPDMSVVAKVYTSEKGRFSFGTVAPGHYAVKAMGIAFLPSLRENVRVRASTVVNLTLNTLYEVMQWLPAEPRSGDAQQDDWKWTLRSAANRPLLRWLEDGPLVVVSDGPGKTPKLKARLMATGQEGAFGENGERISASLEDTPSNSRELLARVDFAPGTDAGIESTLGFRQELGFAGSVQSLAAVSIHPEVEGAGSEGLDEAAVRTWETVNLGDEFEGEVGAEQVVARFDHASSNTVVAALPFVTAGWRSGDQTFHYRMTTIVPGMESGSENEASAWLPAVSIRNGNLALEHGLHQELGWERRTDASGVAVVFFADRLDNPMLEAMTRFAPGGEAQVLADSLFDRSSGLIRVAGPGYSTAGLMATADRRLPGGNQVRLSYANSDALVMPALPHPASLNTVLTSAHVRRSPTYSISLSGILDGSGTRWRASYRWQPEETVTRVAPFAAGAADPFLSVHLRQPVINHHDGAHSVDVMVDVRNLLAEGFRPFVLNDGSVVMFAQDQRSVSGGLAFTF